ncbi:hypothetical protein N7520_010283 [Penicillium odoratum]|uniref:uncharacterized protein n=1 Tax=Penicillium odoratum TaxID=1167516 RepID=UPI002548FC59|nr:uncharacterized protein N7520_010283 [Penicillium odoratum]KAJ5745101.1 hypothetical protein N7520_010283 [Penicillium odoratum]
MDQSTYEPKAIVHCLKEQDEMGQRIVLINALVDFGRVEKMPSERIISETESQCTPNTIKPHHMKYQLAQNKILLCRLSRATVRSV